MSAAQLSPFRVMIFSLPSARTSFTSSVSCARARVSGTISLDENAMDTRIKSPFRIAKSARVSVVATTGGVGLLEVGLVVERFRVGAAHQVQKLHLPELDGVAFRL